MQRIFVTGIGTGIGKTLVSALLVEALGGEYWKPIQAGGLEHTDLDQVRALVTNPKAAFHPERYRLATPASPNIAAMRDRVSISLDDFKAPEHSSTLIIEGAGGILVPINETVVVADLIKILDASVIIVSRNYLGSINHTLLTFEELRRRGAKILGIVFNGASFPEGEETILKFTGLPRLFSVGEISKVDSAAIAKIARDISLRYL